MIKFIGSNNSLLLLDRDTEEIVVSLQNGLICKEKISNIEKMFLKSRELKFIFKKNKVYEKENKGKNNIKVIVPSFSEAMQNIKDIPKDFKNFVKNSLFNFSEKVGNFRKFVDSSNSLEENDSLRVFNSSLGFGLTVLKRISDYLEGKEVVDFSIIKTFEWINEKGERLIVNKEDGKILYFKSNNQVLQNFIKNIVSIEYDFYFNKIDIRMSNLEGSKMVLGNNLIPIQGQFGGVLGGLYSGLLGGLPFDFQVYQEVFLMIFGVEVS